MKHAAAIVGGIGCAVMAYGGASIGAQLRTTRWHSVPIALFAIGILLIAYSYVLRVELRVESLEAELRALRGPNVA